MLTLKHRLLVLLGLALAMAATRMSHFGSTSLLPDASLAVFLVGGLALQSLWGFSVLIALEFGVDVLSAKTAVEAGWCLTPAYWGLLPTYGLLWLAGLWLGRQGRFDFLSTGGVSLVAVTGAFLISNAFWYALSNTVTDLNALEYATAVAKYFPPYLGSAFLYLVPLWLGWKLTRRSSLAA
jgi:hypothetical protein